MLDGVVPYPPEFARRYREKGYWRDLSLAEEFAPVFRRHAKRVAVIDRDARITYAEIDRVSDRLALTIRVRCVTQAAGESSSDDPMHRAALEIFRRPDRIMEIE